MDSCFSLFSRDITGIDQPSKFTFPFYYEAHQLAKIAASELQERIRQQLSALHSFGTAEGKDPEALGKMFGVLVVKDVQGRLGYLSAFSGKLAGRNLHEGFVPPVFDILAEDGFFRQGENEIVAVNAEIDALLSSEAYHTAKRQMDETVRAADKKLSEYRNWMKREKQLRKQQRNRLEELGDFAALQALLAEHKNISLKHQYDFKILAAECLEQKAKVIKRVEVIEDRITALKEKRKQMSANLQKQIFDHFQFLDINGETKGLIDIFEGYSRPIPPGGAGECAAPKLLQYAFQHQYSPICMAEFWWGQSPKSEVRKHGNFYPACRSKCEPILLGHMLKGLEMDENPLLHNKASVSQISIIYEDDVMLAVNKPAEFLSVPGKNETESVYSVIRKQYPEADEPIVVHRLDMSTSGIMLLAKTKEAHKCLQEQFQNREIKKRYVALLDGLLVEKEGKISLPLRVDLDDRPRQLVCEQYGKEAVTFWKMIGKSDTQSLVHFFPLTGRTHQLRVHSAHSRGLHCPIVGDDLYGSPKDRLHLHAEWIQFRHPVSCKKMELHIDAEFGL